MGGMSRRGANTRRGGVGGVGGLIRTAITGVITIGIVLGMWRWLGGGVSITDPAWIGNASATVQGWATAIPNFVERVLGGATE